MAAGELTDSAWSSADWAPATEQDGRVAPGYDSRVKRGLDREIPHPEDLEFGELRHRLWLHPGVSDQLREWPHLYKRLGLVLRHLAAQGRTTVVKGCRDVNRGWRRSPLGGAGGMQYYLWWTPRGSPPVTDLELPERAILVRAVRHHDDHAPLTAGDLDDYLALVTAPDLGDDIAGRPWTDAQVRFVEDRNAVRLIRGRPGSGKTTALWRAVEARRGERILYLTWSRALRQQAEENFVSFAPSDVHVDTLDFTTFVGEICGADVAREPLAASRDRFHRMLGRLGRNVYGPWARRRNALHAELRAVLHGRAVADIAPDSPGDGLARLSDPAYLELRGRRDGVGTQAAKALLRVAKTLPGEGVRQVFPELVAAGRAIERLRGGFVPDGLDRFDQVVVDEIQDLTLLESAVVVDYCLAVGRRRKRTPRLLMAGDSGQTVRPTGFEWGPLSDLLARRLSPPRAFDLEEHLRCPSGIAQVVDRATHLYDDIAKHARPTKQRRQSGAQHVDAYLLHVAVAKRSQAVKLVERLRDADGAVVLTAQDDIPEWLPERLRESVLTPAETKGLEYQSVCVLDPGRLLSGLAPEDRDLRRDGEIDQHVRRTEIDHLRVALSRATETLAFLDVEAGDEETARSRELLGNPAPFDASDLVGHLVRTDASPEERVLVCVNDARVFIDSVPDRAWQRACQALRLLGDPDLPNGVSDRTVRAEARATMLATAARLLVGGAPRGVDREAVFRTAMQTIETRSRDSDLEARALTELESWSADRQSPPFALLEAARELGQGESSSPEWLREALLPAAQALRRGLETASEDPVLAAELADADLEAWLKLTFFVGDAEARSRLLRRSAFDALLQAAPAGETPAQRRQRWGRAESLLESVSPDLRRLGRFREAQGRPLDAADAYRQAGAHRAALRVLRYAGLWEKAAPLAEGEVREDLDWLMELDQLIERRPAGQNRRLREGERDRLEKLLDSVQRRPPRKGAGRR